MDAFLRSAGGSRAAATRRLPEAAATQSLPEAAAMRRLPEAAATGRAARGNGGTDGLACPRRRWWLGLACGDANRLVSPEAPPGASPAPSPSPPSGEGAGGGFGGGGIRARQRAATRQRSATGKWAVTRHSQPGSRLSSASQATPAANAAPVQAAPARHQRPMQPQIKRHQPATSGQSSPLQAPARHRQPRHRQSQSNSPKQLPPDTPTQTGSVQSARPSEGTPKARAEVVSRLAGADRSSQSHDRSDQAPDRSSQAPDPSSQKPSRSRQAPIRKVKQSTGTERSDGKPAQETVPAHPTPLPPRPDPDPPSALPHPSFTLLPHPPLSPHSPLAHRREDLRQALEGAWGRQAEAQFCCAGAVEDT